MFRAYLPAMALAIFAAAPLSAAQPPAQTLRSATEVLDELAAIPLKSIPPALLADAKGVMIVPHAIKAGLIFGGRGGHGVLLVRDLNGAWGEPVFVNLGGASVGLQAGVEATDVVLVFRTQKGLDRLMEGKRKITLGADVSIAAGPVGRQATAGTDATLRSEIVSYSRSRGLFAGLALDGAAIFYDNGVNAAYRRDVRPETAKLTEMLRIRLAEMSSFTPPPGPRVVMPSPAFLGPPTGPAMPGIPATPLPVNPPPVVPVPMTPAPPLASPTTPPPPPSLPSTPPPPLSIPSSPPPTVPTVPAIPPSRGP